MTCTTTNQDKIAEKRRKEQYVVTQMIELYCHGKHGSKRGQMCAECQELAEYARARSEHCPHMEEKTFCSNCKTHCYKAEMREKIRAVMRYSGPRIMFYHPFMATWHVITSRKEKREMARSEASKSQV